MKHTTTTAIAIDTAARASTGDFYAMRRECARFCTESLVDAATQSLEALTSSERAKFASTVSSVSTWRRDRDWALEALCSYIHAVRMREWSASFERSVAAAKAEFAGAYAALGAAL